MRMFHLSSDAINFLLILLLALVMVTNASPQGKKGFDPVSTQKIIEKGNALFMDAMGKADADEMIKNYSKDAILFAPNQPMAVGKEAIRKSFIEFSKMGKVKLLLKLKNVIGNGNIAVASGTYEIEITPEGKGPIKDNGKYVNVWQMQKDGTWKLTRDIWNTDIPEPVPQQ